jgi:nuclear-control-of-ATPase protein 2
MPSEFVDHYTRVLSFSASRPVSPGPSARSEPRLNEATNALTGSAKHPERKAKLHALLVSLNQNTTPQDVQQYTRSLQDISHPGHDVANITEISGEVFTPLDPEEVAMEGAIIGKLAVALYSAGLEIYLTQATEAEAEAEWWADVEGSRASVAIYLLQSMLLISAILFFSHC